MYFLTIRLSFVNKNNEGQSFDTVTVRMYPLFDIFSLDNCILCQEGTAFQNLIDGWVGGWMGNQSWFKELLSTFSKHAFAQLSAFLGKKWWWL